MRLLPHCNEEFHYRGTLHSVVAQDVETLPQLIQAIFLSNLRE